MATLIAGNRLSLDSQSMETAAGITSWNNNYASRPQSAVTASTAQKYDDLQSATLTLTGTGTALAYREPRFAVTAGEVIEVSGYVYTAATNRQAGWYVDFYTSLSGTYVTAAEPAMTALVAGSWTLVKSTITVPATAGGALLAFKFAANSGEQVWWDRAYVGPGQVVVPPAPPGDPAVGAEPGYLAGRTVLWEDSFTGSAGAAVSTTTWTHETGGLGWGQGELQAYQAANTTADGNGRLKITAKQEAGAGGASYTSGRIHTQGKRNFQYGRVEARLRFPRGASYWPAFWMQGAEYDYTGTSPNGWPYCGEIDIVESVDQMEQGQFHTHAAKADGTDWTFAAFTPGGSWADDWHVWALEWTQDRLEWFVDGASRAVFTPADMPAGGVWRFNKPMYVLLNMALDGALASPPDQYTVFPQSLWVDYVRVYSPVVIDTAPPSVPGNLRTTAVGATTTSLAWDASTDNIGVTGYEVTVTGPL